MYSCLICSAHFTLAAVVQTLQTEQSTDTNTQTDTTEIIPHPYEQKIKREKEERKIDSHALFPKSTLVGERSTLLKFPLSKALTFKITTSKLDNIHIICNSQ